MGPPSFWVWASLLALHSEREKVNAGNLVIPYYLKMEVMALGLVQTVHGELNFLFPCILLGSSGFRKEVAGRRPTVLARAPCIQSPEAGMSWFTQYTFWEGPRHCQTGGDLRWRVHTGFCEC